MIVTFANPKGGVGKTTLLRVLAGEAVKRGVNVVIIDCDTSQNATRWRDFSEKLNLWPSNIQLVDVETPQEAEQAALANNINGNLVFIDLEGTENVFLGVGLARAELIICPIKLSNDAIFGAINIAGPLMDQLREAGYTPGPVLVVVTDVDMIDLRSKRMQKFWEVIREAEWQVADTILTHRKIYKDLEYGGTLYTLADKDEKATAEGVKLYDEIFSREAV